jgi:hypothetical protein
MIEFAPKRKHLKTLGISSSRGPAKVRRALAQPLSMALVPIAEAQQVGCMPARATGIRYMSAFTGIHRLHRISPIDRSTADSKGQASPEYEIVSHARGRVLSWPLVFVSRPYCDAPQANQKHPS